MTGLISPFMKPGWECATVNCRWGCILTLPRTLYFCVSWLQSFQKWSINLTLSIYGVSVPWLYWEKVGTGLSLCPCEGSGFSHSGYEPALQVTLQFSQDLALQWKWAQGSICGSLHFPHIFLTTALGNRWFEKVWLAQGHALDLMAPWEIKLGFPKFQSSILI